MKQSVLRFTAPLILIAALSGCGVGKDAASRCQTAPAAANAITAGLTVAGGSLRGASAVKSSDFNKLWFVAADIEGPGLTGSSDVGVWATNALDGSGSVFAVNDLAKQSSDWGDGGATDAKMSMTDDGAKTAADCVASALS